MATSLFVKPDLSAFEPDPSSPYYGEYLTYSHYNYLRGGIVSKFKLARFEAALKMARPYFGRTNAIDMGCADGIFLPSLAKYFPHVTGVDRHEPYVALARNVIAKLGLTNVDTVCNGDETFDEVRAALAATGRQYGVVFLLETLEHVGHSAATMYQDKLDFLDQLLSLTTPDGVVFISVPKMVGVPFLLKYAVQTAARMHKEPVSLRDGARAVLTRSASHLESKWSGGHVGFDDRKLGRLLEERYDVVARRDLMTTAMWAVSRRRK
jgi:2-polyprenyl-3-methyl-5-hydroxy-6-metoxy-1,4-benzoquinol methylase